jgi:energy-converting hydrogenase B subunit D
MSVIQAIALVLTAAGATAVVLTREPFHQALVLGFYGLILTILFVALQAPDVALSIAGVGSLALPAMILLSLTRMRESRK